MSGPPDLDLPKDLGNTKKKRKTLNLVQRTNLAKKRIKTALWLYFLKRIHLNYNFIFHAMLDANRFDMINTQAFIDHKDLYEEVKFFLTEFRQYMRKEQVDNMKDDWISMILIYRSYVFSDVKGKI